MIGTHDCTDAFTARAGSTAVCQIGSETDYCDRRQRGVQGIDYEEGVVGILGRLGE